MLFHVGEGDVPFSVQQPQRFLMKTFRTPLEVRSLEQHGSGREQRSNILIAAIIQNQSSAAIVVGEPRDRSINTGQGHQNVEHGFNAGEHGGWEVAAVLAQQRQSDQVKLKGVAMVVRRHFGVKPIVENLSQGFVYKDPFAELSPFPCFFE
jgi:hypothetical protein